MTAHQFLARCRKDGLRISEVCRLAHVSLATIYKYKRLPRRAFGADTEVALGSALAEARKAKLAR